MNAIAKAIDAINELFGRIIAPLIAIITLIVLYDIVSRFFFRPPKRLGVRYYEDAVRRSLYAHGGLRVASSRPR